MSENRGSLTRQAVFGEKWLHERIFLPITIMDFFMKTLRMPLLLIIGRFNTWIPLQLSPLTVIFGKPISIIKQEQPTDEYVEKIYHEYYETMKIMFNEYKMKLGYSDKEVLIIKEEKSKLIN
ncbi:unnamed protein product [Didymodactylos carnosus]|uniref:diacylglycerol O-acyltransferase n=1 Tax=Didymodactylos carnosus TaxID=1234261 RepID=A0A815UW99_9BILA|nr:unnamed protein product [Didymodactylos carnosus]CAF4379130.1 unnamed protein product [Didymodactylos carnosus]